MTQIRKHDPWNRIKRKTPIVRKEHSEKMKEWWADPENRARVRAKQKLAGIRRFPNAVIRNYRTAVLED